MVGESGGSGRHEAFGGMIGVLFVL